MEYELVEMYRGVPITQEPGIATYHIGQMYLNYTSLEDIKRGIDSMLKKREERQKYLSENEHQVFDIHRGDCLEINGELFTIQTMEDPTEGHWELDGKEYIYIHNSRGSKYEKINLRRKLFSGRIKDAIEAIRSGEGDLLSTTSLFGSRSEHVIRFLDREAGEKIRQEVIRGFENSEFGICLKINFPEGYGKTYDVGEGDRLVNGMWQDRVTPKLFSTEDEAHEYAEKLTQYICGVAGGIPNDDEMVEYLKQSEDMFELIPQGVYHEYKRLHCEDHTMSPFYFDVCQTLIK